MKLQLNGKELDVDVVTLSDLLNSEGLGDAKVATSANGKFVPAADRDEYKLRDGDNIEVLAPMQGG